MKSTFTIKTLPKVDKFPKLMINKTKKLIILATDKNFNGIQGIVVYRSADDPHHLGYYSETWNTVCFKDFLGTVTLSND